MAFANLFAYRKCKKVAKHPLIQPQREYIYVCSQLIVILTISDWRISAMNTRQKLRRLIKEGADINTDIDDQEYAPLLKKITKITKENETIQSAENNTLQLKAGITRITNASFLTILENKKNLVFNEQELAQELTSMAQDEDEEEPNWLKFSEIAMGCFKTVFLPFPVQITATDRQPQQQGTPKEKAARRKRSQLPPSVVAEKLARFDSENVRALQSVYNDIIRSYIDGGSVPMPFYKLICDPTSFQKSVNNAFQLSFLIQSNLVRVTKTESGETMLDPLDANAPFTSQKGGDNSVHAVTTLDYELWESTVNNYQIETSMICE